MADSTTIEFHLGDKIRIRGYDGLVGHIVELRGNLGPGGKAVYRIRYPRKPRAMYSEVLAEQMELLEAAGQPPGGA